MSDGGHDSNRPILGTPRMRTASESVGWLNTEGPLTVSPQFGPVPWRVGGQTITPQRLIAARSRIEVAIRKLIDNHVERRGFTGYDQFDGDMDWLMAEVSGAFFGIVERERTPAQTWGTRISADAVDPHVDSNTGKPTTRGGESS